MGRILADGTFKPKPSVQKKIDRMYGPIKFENALRKNTPVKVFLGAGWEKGIVLEWSKDRCYIRLARGNRSVTCYDARNLEVLSST